MTVDRQGSRLRAEIDAMIGRAEQMCERYRLAAARGPRNGNSVNALQRLSRSMEATLGRLRAQRAAERGPRKSRGEPKSAS